MLDLKAEVRVVCLIWVQKCVDLAHSVRLELELLRQIVYYRMEELITLHYGNFTILRERVRDFTWCTTCLTTLLIELLEPRSSLMKWVENTQGGHCLQARVGTLLIGCLLHNAASMRKKEHHRCSWRSHTEETEEAAPEHPSMGTIIGATDDAII